MSLEIPDPAPTGHPELSRRPSGPSRSRHTRTVVIGASAVAVLAAGWFLLSWRIGHNAAGDAFGEAIGAALGLLIALSVIGAVRGGGSDDDS